MTTAPRPLTITAEEIAADLGVDEQTVRRWFRAGDLPGRKVSRRWTTTRAAYDGWRAGRPLRAPEGADTTAEDIAASLGVTVVTVRGWFAHEGAPGVKVRLPGERAARWRATRTSFDAWYAGWLTSGNTGGSR